MSYRPYLWSTPTFVALFLAVGAGDELLRQFSDVQSALRKRSALFSSHVTKAFDVRCTGKSPSACAKKTMKVHKASGPMVPEERSEHPGSGSNSVGVEMVEAEVL